MRALCKSLPKQLVFAAVLVGLAGAATAHELTLNECLEGSDFIKHAAQSRDYGMTREAFLTRMEGDIRAIQSFPPHLRWFIQDADDEALLTQAAQLVFDAPREPESHQSDFLVVCVERVGSGDVQADLSPTAAEVVDQATVR